MSDFNPRKEITARVVATDLDGTLIPLPDHPENRRDLDLLKAELSGRGIPFVFATGRHFESVLDAIDEYGLPIPEWIVCDVGSSVYRRTEDLNFNVYEPYEQHLDQLTLGNPRKRIEDLLGSIDGLKFQADARQQRFKISYESEADALNHLVDQIDEAIVAAELPYSVMGSLDPFAGIGLIDVLPKNVSKAYALVWLAKHADFLPDEVIFSGDSGNDLAALVCGFRATVVANASEGLVDKVREALAQRGLEDRVLHAKGTATSGVLEGCRHFGLL